jgi:hypothetical protein
MTKTNSSPVIDAKTEAALAKVALLTRVLPQLRQELEAERANLPESQAVIEGEILKAKMQLDKVQTKIDKEKNSAKKRKKEIDEWKRWYNSNPHIDKTEARAKLSVEIDWRGQEIASHEAKISQLEAEKLVKMEALEKQNLFLEAYLNGVFDLPVEEDPRLLEAEAALAAAKAEAESLSS